MQLSPSKCSICELWQTLAIQYREALRERRLALYLSDMGELPHIEADSKRLFQVFDNLIVNAIKYTPDGGQVSVTVDQMKGQDGDDWVEVIVSDTGIGIDPEHIELIFDKFYQTGHVTQHSTGRTKFKGGGPGLGLAIAKGIVDAHGGRIWAESEGYDEARCLGSQFYVVLPVKSQIVVREIPSPFASARVAQSGAA
jgi:signal transduction histidine kinase